MITYDPEPKQSTRNFDLMSIDDEVRPTLSLAHNNIMIIDNVLSVNECKYLRDFIDGEQGDDLKTKKRVVGNCESLSEIVEQRCTKFIPKSVYYKLDDDSVKDHRDDTNYWNYDKINSCWRFVECYSGNKMPKHYDARHVINADNVSLFAVMIYLSSNTDGTLEFANGTIVQPQPGRMVIFDHELLHTGNTTTSQKYYIRSELMYTRSRPIETDTDKQALFIYNEALKLNSMDPERAAALEKEAFRLSPTLESLHL